jgi:inosine/xanthosine triphosphatase
LERAQVLPTISSGAPFSSTASIATALKTFDLPLQSAHSELSPGDTASMIRIAVGSTRGPKLRAVEGALESIGALLEQGRQFEIVGFAVESGVSHTPSSRQELMRGARQRAERLTRLADQLGPWSYFVGLEGGLDVVQENGGPARRVFLESWAYVTEGQRGYFGKSGGVEVPEVLASEVLDQGVELATAIDRFAGETGIRDAQGAWGVLTGDLIGRQEAFRVALIAAFAPFFNATLYRCGRANGNAV